jgi:tight adherence protein B
MHYEVKWVTEVPGKISTVVQVRYHIRAEEYFRFLISGIFLIIFVAYLFYENIFAAILLCPYLHFYIMEKSHQICMKKKRQMGRKFKDGMLAVSFALNVGYSMENAFKEAIGELKLLYGAHSDIVEEFSNIVRKVERNENIEDALEDYAVRSGIEDVKYFAEVFRYAKRSGGDLISIIRNTAGIISEKIEVYNEIQTVISGKKIEQKIMGMVLFGIILYLKVTAPEFIQPLYGNATGIVIMTICLGLYLISDYLAKRIIAIEV